MKKYLIITLIAIAFAVNANAQSTIETILTNIAKNNKTILANVQYWEAQKLQYKTGLNPDNPTVAYDYLIGSPSIIGDQTEVEVTQSFDFPTAYIKKKQLSNEKITQAEFQLIAKRQDVLLNAKIICFELVNLNKLRSQLLQRKRNTEKLVDDFKKRLDNGEGNILDVHKARLQLIEINKEVQQNFSSINQLNQTLTELNGGISIVYSDTIYPPQVDIPVFEQLLSEIEDIDPVRKILEQEKYVTQKQVEFSKTMSYPKFEMGYHYQGILGQKYNGVHAGITIPLWENKNTVKMQQTKFLYSELNVQDHNNQHYYETKQLYEKYQNLKITLTEYQTVFTSLNNTELLNKALLLGQISTIEYFMEMNYYYTAFNNYLQTENEFYKAIAELYKYQL